MKWTVRKPGAKLRCFRMWHTWFAWYPVRVPTHGKMSGMTKVWLEKVKRKGGKIYSYDCSYYWEWEYKFKGDR